MKIDARLEAHLLRVLLEDPWGDVAPEGDDEAMANYCRTLWALTDFEYTDAGIEAYESTLVYGERFNSVARFRSYLDREINKRREWLSSKAPLAPAFMQQRRIVR